MAKVSCSVINCSHNDRGICYANQISMNGKKAHSSVHTCCSSFLDNSSYSTLINNTNNDGPCELLSCNVKTCNHNYNDICSLNNISVTSNNTKANLYSETYCSSFED